RLENVGRFFRFLRGYAEVVEDPRLSCLAPHLEALVAAGEDPGLGEADDDVEAVSVLTVHKAKGLEFGIVFVAGLADGRFPSRGRRGLIELPDGLRRTGVEPGSEADEPALAEERRLAYVAMTRARDRLVLTYAARAGTSRPRRPSPFLIEALDGPPPMPDTGLRLVAIEAPVTVPVPAALPWTSPRGLLDLSFSQIDSYLTCPRQYEFRHRLRLPTPAHHALSYGSALHAAVAAYHQQERRGTLPSEADLLASLKAAWSPEGYLSREHEEARFAAATAALARFRAERLASAAQPPAAVEEPFSVVIDETRIRGRFDRVDDTPEGTVITDYKSGDVRDPVRARERARTSLQLSVYALAFDAIHAARPSRLQLHFLDTGLVGQAAVTDARLDAARERIATAAAGIRAGAFEATPGPVACAYCPFRDICPASASRGWAAR
ncbi:MAG TPA: PD-(D/E)XK nuclease family protein, partial [Candidatus Limnocylindrales bacterium]|nr:PD-(D/E)XK nuclease family protein [Candidatus Limnocylindrales bacterium]